MDALLSAVELIAAPAVGAEAGCRVVDLARGLLVVLEMHEKVRVAVAASLRECFEHFDANSDGYLSFDEFTHLMQAVDKAVDEEELQDQFIACTKVSKKEFGASADTISREAFVSVCERQGMKMRKLVSYAHRGENQKE